MPSFASARELVAAFAADSTSHPPLDHEVEAALRAEAAPRAGGDARFEGDAAVRACTRLVMLQSKPCKLLWERRRDQRVYYPYPIWLTPLENNEPLVNQTFSVVGKHLSERGVDFYCPMPLPHRRVIASFEPKPGEWVAFVLDLRWCRFTGRGWYENGGRFVENAECPLANGQFPRPGGWSEPAARPLEDFPCQNRVLT